MKYGRIFRIVVVVILLDCGLVGLTGTPAMAAPLLELSPSSGAVGTTVTISGENLILLRGTKSISFSTIRKSVPAQ